MRSRGFIVTFLVAIALAAFVGFTLFSNRAEKEALGTQSKGAKAGLAQERDLEAEVGKKEATPPNQQTALDERFEYLADGSLSYKPAIQRSNALHSNDNVEEDFYIVQQLFDDYKLIVGTYPVGSENLELTAQLLGENERRLRVIDANSSAISPDGELLDRWGEPFRFHRLSASVIVVQSKGPDRVLWTDDDLSLDRSE